VLRENLVSLGAGQRATVIGGALLKSLATVRAEIVFLDPPYALEREYGEALALLGAGDSELVVVQHSVRFELGEEYGRLRRMRVVRQGDNALSFYEWAGPEACPT
jgi:16S rRNA G966 N2-methylase RsmD